MPLTSSLTHLLVWKSLLSLALESKELWALVVVTALVMLVFRRLSAPRRRRSSGSLFSSRLNGVSVLGPKPASCDKPVYQWLHQLSQRHGPVITVQSGTTPVVVVCGRDVAEELLQSHLFLRTSWTAWLRQSDPESHLLHGTQVDGGQSHSDVDIPRIVSHLATSEFFEDCVTSSLDKVIAGIRSLHDAPFDPEPAMTSLVFDAIYSLFFGSRISPAKYKKILRAHTRLNEVVDQELERRFAESGETPDDALTEIRALYDQILGPVTAEIEMLNSNSGSDSSTSLAGQLLAQRGTRDRAEDTHRTQFTSTELSGLARLLVDRFRDWLDSCRAMLCWTLLYLCHHQHVQRHCQHEIDAKLDGHDPTLADRHLLSYTQATLLELLRLFPVRPLAPPLLTTGRATLGNRVVPASLTTIVNQWSLHQDPSDFIHQRLPTDPGHGATVKRLVWAPTLTGSLESGAEDELLRIQMLLMVSSLLHNFNLRLCSPAHGQGRGQEKADFTPQGTLLLRPRPFKVTLAARPRERRRPKVDWRSVTVCYSHPSVLGNQGVSSYPQ